VKFWSWIKCLFRRRNKTGCIILPDNCKSIEIKIQGGGGGGCGTGPTQIIKLNMEENGEPQ